MRKLVKLVCGFALILGLGACSSEKNSNDNTVSSSSDVTVVKVGVCGSSNYVWNAVQKVLDEQGEKILIQLVEFDAYNLPNEALNSGEIDLNAFQHKAYLQSEINQNGYKLSVLADTVIAPLTLYSHAYASVDEIKNAAKNSDTALQIGVPNDGTNLSRAIKLLEAQGFIKVKKEAGYTPELSDVEDYLYNIEIVPVAANTLPATLDDFAASTINGTYAVPAGLNSLEDGLARESVSDDVDNPYVNVLVVREGEENKEVFKKIADAYHTTLPAAFIIEYNKGASIPAFDYDENYEVSETFVEDIIKYVSPLAK